jgi:hypothetical protein
MLSINPGGYVKFTPTFVAEDEPAFVNENTTGCEVFNNIFAGNSGSTRPDTATDPTVVVVLSVTGLPSL